MWLSTTEIRNDVTNNSKIFLLVRAASDQYLIENELKVRIAANQHIHEDSIPKENIITVDLKDIDPKEFGMFKGIMPESVVDMIQSIITLPPNQKPTTFSFFTEYVHEWRI